MIFSDHDSLFTSVFWQELHKLLGTRLSYLVLSPDTAMDGATGRTDRTRIQLLRQCVVLDQEDWLTSY